MYAVTVTLTIKEGQMDDFLPLMLQNARASRGSEPGCQQFDVCRDGDQAFLYELYDDCAAFDSHLASAHFQQFDLAAANMVTDKEIRLFDEVLR